MVHISHRNSIMIITTLISVFVNVCDFLFVYEMSRQQRSRFVPNSQARHVWSLAWMSLNVKVKGQGHHGQKTGYFANILGHC